MGQLMSMSHDSATSPRPSPTFSSKFLAKYDVLGKIGEGGFGAAYEVRDRSTNAVWCAKIIPFNASSTNEVQEMKKFNNPRIVQLREAIADKTAGQMYIIMEFCEGGTLKSWIKRNRKHMMLTEPLILQMLYQICEAVHSCHELHTIHRDLKPDNVLLTRDRIIKLCDFGVARQLNENSAAASFCGTPPYMAPEVFIAYLRHCSGQAIEGYTYKSEVWSIGCMLLDMATVKGVFVSERTTNLGLRAAEAMQDRQRIMPDFQQIVDDEIPHNYQIIRRLLPQLLDLNSETRISLEAVLTDPDIRKALETPNDRKKIGLLTVQTDRDYTDNGPLLIAL